MAGLKRFGSSLAAAGLVACGGAEPAPVDEPTSLQAVLSIERLEDASRSESSRASAMAEFVLLPADADAHATLDAAGLRTQLPERRGCSEAAESAPGQVHAEQLFPEQLELLEAGEVSIRVDGTVTRLALNLFPPSGSASGVIYTTPDQLAALPPDVSYSISATGSDAIPPLSLQEDAPRTLDNVTVGGQPLERATHLVAGQPLDFTWLEGEATDRVFVELSGSDTSVLCTFSDEEGSGSVPAALTAKLGQDPVRIGLHRVRETVRAQEPARRDGLLAEPMTLETLVRFDFELTSTLRVD